MAPAARCVVVLGMLCLFTGSVLHCLYGYVSGPRLTSVHAAGTDDAYISFRYAKNLLQGHGLVFNPGEKVEGYTNLLHVLMMAGLLSVVPDDDAYLAACLLNLLFLAIAAGLFFHLARSRLEDPAVAAASLLFGLSPLIWLWTASGMETVPVMTLYLALWVTAERYLETPTRRRLAALAAVLALLVLMRADGFVGAALAVAYFVFAGRPRLALHVAAAVAPVIVGMFAWRYGYYGDWLPNTYHAKVDGPISERLRMALRQLWGLAFYDAFVIHGVALLAIFARDTAALLRGGLDPAARPRPSFAGFFTVGFLAYWLYVGGDHFGERFLIFLFPMGILVFLELFHLRLDVGRLALLVVLVLLFQCEAWRENDRFRYDVPRRDGWITLGKFLRTHYDADTYVATTAAGKIPYFSGFRTLDMLGLTEPAIGRREIDHFRTPGHDKRDPEYVLSRSPDLIVTWIEPDFDLKGLPAARYQAAGYRLRYLADVRRLPTEQPVIEVTALPPDKIRQLIHTGRAFGVLERQP